MGKQLHGRQFKRIFRTMEAILTWTRQSFKVTIYLKSLLHEVPCQTLFQNIALFWWIKRLLVLQTRWWCGRQEKTKKKELRCLSAAERWDLWHYCCLSFLSHKRDSRCPLQQNLLHCRWNFGLTNGSMTDLLHNRGDQEGCLLRLYQDWYCYTGPKSSLCKPPAGSSCIIECSQNSLTYHFVALEIGHPCFSSSCVSHLLRLSLCFHPEIGKKYRALLRRRRDRRRQQQTTSGRRTQTGQASRLRSFSFLRVGPKVDKCCKLPRN